MKTRNVAFGSLAVAITLLMLPAGALGDGDEKHTETYNNGFLGDVTYEDPQCDPDLAQACFVVPSGMTEVTITIEDDSGLEVGFYLDGEETGDCGSGTFDVTDVEQLHVTANGPLFGFLDCSGTTATSGTITAVFS